MSLYDFCLSGDLVGVRAALKRGDDVNQVWQHGDCKNPECKDRPNCDFKAIPIMGAIRGGHADVVDLLLQQPAIDVNMRIINGFTPLHWACFFGNVEIVAMLLPFFGSEPEMAGALVAGIQMHLVKDNIEFVQNCGLSKSEQRQQKRAEKVQRDQLAEKKRIQKEQEEKRKEEQKKKEEEKEKIGKGKGRNARKRKKEEEKKRKEKEVLESQVGETVPEDFVPEEVEGYDHSFEEAEVGENKKKVANEKTGAHGKKETADIKAENKTLIEFLEGQILQLEEDLECPVCLDIASTTPIYKCTEDHLICRWAAPSTKLI